jgi:4,5-dihydroxyphthalate decarboxylase
MTVDHSSTADKTRRLGEPATQIRCAISRYPHTAALVDGAVPIPGAEADFLPITGSIVDVFRAMSRNLAFDVCEMGLSTALAAKHLQRGFSPIPVFLTRRFDAEALCCRDDGSITDPSQLAGRQIAVRSPFVTDVIWCTGLLVDHFDVPAESIRWMVTGEEHLDRVALPPNCERRPGANLGRLLREGEVDAIIDPYHPAEAGIRRAIEDRDALERGVTYSLGAPTIHHVVVVKDALVEGVPEFPKTLFDAFVQSKRPFLDALAAGDDVLAPLARHPRGAQHIFGVDATEQLLRPDPMQYGLQANRASLGIYAHYCAAVGLLPPNTDLDQIFLDVS